MNTSVQEPVIIPATIQVHNRCNHNTFGSTEAFFNQFVRGKDLPVLERYQQFYKVLPVPGSDPEEDFYLVHESELKGKEYLHD